MAPVSKQQITVSIPGTVASRHSALDINPAFTEYLRSPGSCLPGWKPRHNLALPGGWEGPLCQGADNSNGEAWPAGTDGARAADANALCRFHMLLYLALIGELFFNICQELTFSWPEAAAATHRKTLREADWAISSH